MQTTWTLGALAAVFVAVIVALGFLAGPKQFGTVSSAEDTAIRAAVTDFGSKLKNVSLLAPDASAQIAAQYGTAITPELLARWQAEPRGAPGRQTSSPWPDRIEVTSLEQIGEGMVYHVEGNVVEVTNVDTRDYAAMYPVSLTLEKIDGKWLISDWQSGAVQAPHVEAL